MAVDPGDKPMRLRYSGSCRLCGTLLPAGAGAVYERGTKTVRCVTCPADVAAIDGGVAGASARREHERRAVSREQRIRADHPKLGGLILALSEEPQTTAAWARGAIGEEVLAERLRDLPDTARVLHDRRIPGSRANIDLIVIAPSGVWVIDAKRYKGKRPSLHVTGGLFSPRVEQLRIGGRDGSKLVVGVQAQVALVTAALGDVEDSVNGVLCFVDADWPILGGAFTVGDVDVLWPRLLVKRVTQAADQSLDVEATCAKLAAAFPAA